MRPSNIKLFLFGLLVAGLVPLQNSIALTVTTTTSGNGHAAHQIAWTDSAGLSRSAVMVDQSESGPGYLYQLTYQVDGSPVVCAGTGITGYPGDGFVENHNTEGSDNNSLDDSTPGTTTVLLSGSSHAIIAYAMPTYQILGDTVPTSIYWFFADGRDNPIFAISQDARATSGNLGGDTRSPYGSLNFDGGNGSSDVGGASYGDTLKFVTLAAPPELVTGLSGWSDNQANTIPYAMEWVSTNEGNAEMGHVATLPITVQDEGTDRDANATLDPRNTEALNGPMIPYGASDTGPDAWAFQLLDYILHPDYAGDTQGAGASIQVSYSKLAWGGNFGRIGGDNDGNNALDDTQYSEHYDSGSDILTGTRAPGMLLAYSVFVVLGTHNGSYLTGSVGTQVTQMENVAQATLSASTGTVASTGPAGVGNATNATITYSPAGYNPTYATWEIAAAANTVNATLTPAASLPLVHPVFVIDDYTSSVLPASISVGAGLTNAGSDYFASVDTSGQRLWITVNHAISNASPLNLVVTPSAGGGAPAPAITSFTPTNGAAGTSVAINGTNFSGATAVAFNGISATNFTVNSATNISVVVPAGATTGTITVTTPGGTSPSATAFTITNSSPGATYSITTSVSPTGDGTVSGGGTFPAGSSEMVTATASAGFVFVGWTGDATGTTSPLTVTVNTNLNITANFVPSGTSITLTVITNLPIYGTVTVSPKLDDGDLKSGKNYTLTATAKSGYLFSNWTGSITTNKNPLIIKVETSMVLQANFIPNPFLQFVGTYNGLFTGANGIVTETNAGMLKGLTLTSKGTYSGSLLFNGASKSFTGSFDLALNASNSLKVGGETLGLGMTLTASDPAPQVTGIISGNGWMSTNLTADRATNSLPPAEYTLLILPNTNTAPANSPGGDGYALITNSAGTARDPAAATAKITGALADGTAFNQTVPVSQDGYVPIYADLYSGKGLLLGWINLKTNTAGISLTWIHPETHSGLYQNGFINVLSTNQILLSQWTDPGNFGSLYNLSELATINDTNIITSITVSIAGGKVSGQSVTGTVAPKTGLLTVTIYKVAGHGAILINGTNISGGGYFLTKTAAGAIKLGP
jgi:uncharacterized repeat protein (TIGR02543 family)